MNHKEILLTSYAPKPGEIRVSYNFTGTLEMPDLRDYNLANASEKLEIASCRII